MDFGGCAHAAARRRRVLRRTPRGQFRYQMASAMYPPRALLVRRAYHAAQRRAHVDPGSLGLAMRVRARARVCVWGAGFEARAMHTSTVAPRARISTLRQPRW